MKNKMLEAQINKLSPQKDDILIVTVKNGLSNEVAQQIYSELEQKINNTVFVITPSIKIENLPEKEMNKLGWYKHDK